MREEVEDKIGFGGEPFKGMNNPAPSKKGGKRVRDMNRLVKFLVMVVIIWVLIMVVGETLDNIREKEIMKSNDFAREVVGLCKKELTKGLLILEKKAIYTGLFIIAEDSDGVVYEGVLSRRKEGG